MFSETLITRRTMRLRQAGSRLGMIEPLQYGVGKIKISKQAGAELGNAQLKLGLDFTFIFCRFGLVELVCWILFSRFDCKDLV